MMLGFQKGTEVVAIRIINKQLLFSKVQGGVIKFAPVDSLKLNPAGIVKEFPDLKGVPIPQMKKEAVKRLKIHIKNMKTSKEIMDYLVKDLGKHGYIFKSYQLPGHRMVRVKQKTKKEIGK